MNIFKQPNYTYIPILLSIILLPCFLGIYLWNEYQKEKEIIVLEIKSYTLDEYISDSGGGIPLIKLVKKSGVKSYWFQGEDGNEKCWVYKNCPDHLVTEKLLRDTYRMDSLNFGNPFFSTTNLSVNPSRCFLEDIIEERLALETTTNLILQRMIPPILFSFFLLFMVYFSFYLIFRTLRKERLLRLMRNDFICNMSHELKTPISTISVALEAIGKYNAGNDPILRKEFIEISRLEIDRLGILVDNVLNLSLYDNGKYVFDKKTLSLDQVILKIINILKVRLEQNGVELIFLKDGNHFNIEGDRSHMINVIHNLIENGIKYSPGVPSITISLKELSNNIQMIIEDKGIGIDPIYQDKIFEQFFRVPQGNIHNVKGYGLGLSYVKSIIDWHNGTILLESTIGKGTRFIIELPKLKNINDD